MLKDITLGQYFPGDTVIHRLDPRTKIIFVLFYIVALFNVKNISGYALIGLTLICAAALAHINAKTLLKAVKPLLVIIIITAFLNLFYSSGTVIFKLWIFKVTKEGLKNAVFMILRLMFLVMGTCLLTYTTSPIMLTDGLEKLFAPLKALKMPVHELAMMMSIALRFIPTLIEETDKIISAQKARGADFDTGNLIQKAKAMLPILVPLFVSSFRRADELATAMESRCYHGGEGRTRLRQLKFETRDYVTLIIGALLIAAVIVLRKYGF